MKDLFEYVNKHKNIDFSQLGLTEIDNVIFSRLAYLDFSDYIGKSISYTARFFSLKDNSNKNNELTKELLAALGNTKRFGSVILSDFTETVNEDRAASFCASSFRLTENISYIAFRGTDEKIMSFYEDAEMAYSFPIPSQIAALRYLNGIAAKQPGIFYLGGHSKGGNLALFAYAFSYENIRKRIIRIYNNDGPGFPKELVKILITPRISNKITTLAPEDSIVGRMLETAGEQKIIKSTASGASQHNVFTWIVNGERFESTKRFSLLSEYMEDTLTESLNTISPDEMKKAVETVYEIAVNSGFKTTNDINRKNYRGIILALLQVLKSENDATDEISVIIKTLIRSLFSSIAPEKILSYILPEGFVNLMDKNEIRRQLTELFKRDDDFNQ